MTSAAGPVNNSKPTIIDDGRSRFGDGERNLWLLDTLMAMRNIQWLLHRISEPSLRLFLVLAVFGALGGHEFCDAGRLRS